MNIGLTLTMWSEIRFQMNITLLLNCCQQVRYMNLKGVFTVYFHYPQVAKKISYCRFKKVLSIQPNIKQEKENNYWLQ